MRRVLEALLHARVDVVPAEGLKSEARAEAESDVVAL
jgi:predicted nucleotidyltransferase